MSRTIGVEAHYVQDDDVKITGSSAGNRLEVSPTIVFDEYQRMKVLRRHTHPCVIPIVDAHVFPVVDAEGYNCWEVIRSYCCDKNPRFSRRGLLDPILVHMPNGPAPVWAVRRGASKRPITSKKRLIQEARDRGTVAEIAESIRYKKRSRDTEKDTLTTLERATPIHRPSYFRREKPYPSSRIKFLFLMVAVVLQDHRTPLSVLGRVMMTVDSFRLLVTCFSSRFMELQMCFRNRVSFDLMKDRSAKRKVVVRHLPPSLSEPDLLSQIDSRFGDSYSWFSFRPGKSNYKTQKHSRAYFGFKSPEDVYEFAAFFNGHVFVNEKGAQFKAIVEYAPSQRVPKPCDKKDPREGSITKDPDYLEFLKLIAQPVENLPSAEVQLERREAEQSGASKPAPIVTPLMEFIRQKRATVIGSQVRKQGSLDVRRGGRRSRAVSANKPSSRPLKRNSEKKKVLSLTFSKQDNSSTASVMDSSLPGISLTMESGKKKILLLKKDRDTPVNSPPQPEQQMETILSSTSRQNQKIGDVGGRLIKGMLVRKEPRPSQSSTLVQPEPRVEPSEAENYKRPPRAGKDYHVSGTNTEKQERRPRNRDRPDRVVWAPLRRADGSNNSEDQLSSSAANNGEVKQRTLLQRSGEVVNSSDGHSLENGSARYSSRRVGSRSRKEDGFAVTGEGKSSRRGGGGDPTSYEASQAKVSPPRRAINISQFQWNLSLDGNL
ncbi:hypothetical protein HID58_079972 [Brassica napus]|uniref:UPF3 domain-containing protein n=1 Tax=Brassica napus TaxID=3708 RepID=A0ABQ7Y3M0_BRANA|nr:hypothetical protein HID58_079972 [Brassica napus]